MKKWRFGGVFLLCLVSAAAAYSQATLRGTVADADNGQPLIGATVAVAAPALGTTTDTLGRFRFDGLAPGRYVLTVSYLGYQTVELGELLVSSGKEQVLSIALQESATSLTAVTVKGSRITSAAAGGNTVRLTQEETLRFPVTFNDPARLAMAYPGLTGADDQANHLIVRGQSPIGMHWRLEGLEIVNPNHTANAGTFSDRTSLNGGGINALSSQLLEDAQFYLGAFPAQYGNATAGLLDMRLRNGNNERREHTFQAGLIGFDLATEGPISKGGSSYLVNYRYSFTGLLSDLGVSFGNEDIRFQDLSFKLHFPGANNSQLDVFGVFGTSSNVFTQPQDTAEWATEKDLYQRIDFQSNVGVVGFTWLRPQATKGTWRLAGSWSGLESERLAEAADLPTPEWDELRQQKTNIQLSYKRKLLPFGSITAGVEGLLLQQSIRRDAPLDGQPTTSRDADGLIVSPFIDWQYPIRRINLQLGWRSSIWMDGLKTSSYAEPRLSASYRLSDKQLLGADYSVSSQAPSPYESALRPRMVRQWSAFWTRYLASGSRLGVQLYHQNLRHFAGAGALSAIHQLEVILPDTSATTQGRTQGIELSLQRMVGQGWWYIWSGSLFDARYQKADGEWAKTRFAQDFASALTLGKEWHGIDKAKRTNRLGFNVALHWNGGQRTLPILETASQAARTTVFDYSADYSRQLPQYFRADFRLYFQKNQPTWNSMLSLDIQNFTGRENVAYEYYDRLLDAVTTRRQLAFIPIMSYRVNW